MKEEELCNHLIHASDGSRCANEKPCKWHGEVTISKAWNDGYAEGYKKAQQMIDSVSLYNEDALKATKQFYRNGYLNAITDVKEAISKMDSIWYRKELGRDLDEIIAHGIFKEVLQILDTLKA